MAGNAKGQKPIEVNEDMPHEERAGHTETQNECPGGRNTSKA